MKLLVGPVCNFSAKVRLALAEKGMVAEIVEVPFSLQDGYEPKHPGVLAVSPRGEVPVLLDGELALYDSTVIVEYLDEISPQPPLLPAQPARRARCRQLEAEADELLWPSLSALRAALAGRDPQAIAAARAKVASLYGRLEQQLSERDYLCDEFSAADIASWVIVHLLIVAGAEPDNCHARVASWHERVASRPAFVAMDERARATLSRLTSA